MYVYMYEMNMSVYASLILSRYEKIESDQFRCKPLWFHQNGCLKADHLDEAKTGPHHLGMNLTQPFQNNSISLSKIQKISRI